MSQKTLPYWPLWENNTIDKNDIRYLVTDGDNKLQRIIPKISWLYYWWNIHILSSKILWIVWPRKPSIYGQKVMQHLFSMLPRYDVVTLSGWALWIDALVHDYSLAIGMPTIVVLWWWIDYYQQSWKYHFLQKVVDRGGLVLSEYTWDMSPKKYTFPQRNRLIAWLSDVLFVPEASMWSGSLITVDKAYEYGVPIYAPMQDIFSVSGMGIAEYIVQEKVKPIDTHLSSLLDIYFGKKSWENQLFTVGNVDNMTYIDWHTVFASSGSVEEDLIGESMKELGI